MGSGRTEEDELPFASWGPGRLLLGCNRKIGHWKAVWRAAEARADAPTPAPAAAQPPPAATHLGLCTCLPSSLQDDALLDDIIDRLLDVRTGRPGKTVSLSETEVRPGSDPRGSSTSSTRGLSS